MHRDYKFPLLNGHRAIVQLSAVPTLPAPAKGDMNFLSRSRAFMSILGGGLLAGLLDGMDAVISVWAGGVTPEQLFQYIASGLMGVRAFAGGLATAAVGCVCHFLIAVGAATAYYFFSLKFPVLVRKPFVCGPIFGLGVYVFMHYIVLPLSALPPQPAHTSMAILNLLFSHAMFVGLPIALISSRMARQPAMLSRETISVVSPESLGGALHETRESSASLGWSEELTCDCAPTGFSDPNVIYPIPTWIW